MTDGARFWAVDLHTHTPASRDVRQSTFGGTTPEEFVAAAIASGLDAVAVTDHNTAGGVTTSQPPQRVRVESGRLARRRDQHQ